MQNLNFLETELLDILFRGKNKNYGAYALRKNYASRAKQAMGYAVLSILLIYGLQQVLPEPDLPLAIHPPTSVHDEIKPLGDVEIICTLPPAGAPALETTTPTIPTEIVRHEVLDQPIEEKEEELKTIAPPNLFDGPTTTNPELAGTGGTGNDPTSTIQPTATGAGPAVAPTQEPTNISMEPMEIPEVMPEFPGGEDAMIEYLRSKMNYPKGASSMGLEGTVFVQFVVNTKGLISDIKVLKGLGMGCEREAIRVIKTMPAWTPGT
jgi:protein TonB